MPTFKNRPSPNAKRQAAFRERSALTAAAADDMIAELSRALDRAGTSWLTDNLPEQRQAALETITGRLQTVKLIAVKIPKP